MSDTAPAMNGMPPCCMRAATGPPRKLCAMPSTFARAGTTSCAAVTVQVLVQCSEPDVCANAGTGVAVPPVQIGGTTTSCAAALDIFTLITRADDEAEGNQDNWVFQWKHASVARPCTHVQHCTAVCTC